MDDELSPYQILDLPSDATTSQIKSRYRQLVLMYHPDKNTNVPPEYFDIVQKAYKKLLNIRRDAKMPDYNIEYQEDDIEVEFNKRMRDLFDMGDVTDNKFTIDTSEFTKEEFEEFQDKFNKDFEKVNQHFKELREDEIAGYQEYQAKINRPIENIDYQDMTDVKYNPRDLQKDPGAIVKHQSNEIGYTSRGSNFGLTKYENLSSITTGKQKLVGNDLGEVFNNDDKFIDLDQHEHLNKVDIEAKLKEYEERMKLPEIEKKSEEELKAMWDNVENKYKEKQREENEKYIKEETKFNTAWEKAKDFYKSITGAL